MAYCEITPPCLPLESQMLYISSPGSAEAEEGEEDEDPEEREVKKVHDAGATSPDT